MNGLLLPSGTGPEIESARLIRSKTFNQGLDGKKKRSIYSMQPVHVPVDVPGWLFGNNTKLEDVDYSVLDEGSFYRVGNAWHTLTVPKNRIGFQYVSKHNGDVDLSLSEVGAVPVRSANITVAPQFMDNRIIWEDVRPGFTLELWIRPDRVEMVKRLTSPVAPNSWAWEIIEHEGDLNIQRTTFGHDNDDHSAISRMARREVSKSQELQMQHEWTPDDFSTNPGKNTRRFRETITGKTIKRNPQTRVPSLDPSLEFPLYVDATITENITANADDGYDSYGSGWNVSGISNLIWCGYYNGLTHGGFRFQTVNLPAADTVDVGTQLNIRINSGAGSPQITISGNDVDDAPVFSGSNLPRNATKTTASTVWNPSTTGLPRTDNVDIQAIIDEIHNRGSWASGNDMAFMIMGTGGTTQISIRDFNHASWNNDVQLVIEHTASGGGHVPSGPFMRGGFQEMSGGFNHG